MEKYVITKGYTWIEGYEGKYSMRCTDRIYFCHTHEGLEGYGLSMDRRETAEFIMKKVKAEGRSCTFEDFMDKNGEIDMRELAFVLQIPKKNGKGIMGRTYIYEKLRKAKILKGTLPKKGYEQYFSVRNAKGNIKTYVNGAGVEYLKNLWNYRGNN